MIKNLIYIILKEKKINFIVTDLKKELFLKKFMNKIKKHILHYNYLLLAIHAFSYFVTLYPCIIINYIEFNNYYLLYQYFILPSSLILYFSKILINSFRELLNISFALFLVLQSNFINYLKFLIFSYLIQRLNTLL